MKNASFFNARFLLPVCAVFIIIGVSAKFQSDDIDQHEIINGTNESSASADTENTIESQEAIDVAPRAEVTAAAGEREAKAAADKLAAAAQAEAEAAEQKAKAAADKLAAAAQAEAEAAEQEAKAAADKLAAAAQAEAEAAEQKAKAATDKTAEVLSKTTVALAVDSSIPQYVVKDGMVDKATYNGYRRFHGTCHACHGQDAAGGSFAPSLVDSLKKIDYDLFHNTVTEGRVATGSTGAASVMPAFSNDPNVMKHLDDIYRYLTARADGAIGPGRPKRLR